MQRNNWRRIWQGRKTPYILVLGGGVVAGLAILTLLFSSIATMAAKTDHMAADRDRLAAETLVDVSLDRMKSLAADMANNPHLPGLRPEGAPPPGPVADSHATRPGGPRHFNERMPADAFLLFDDQGRVVEGSYRDQPLAPDALAAWQASLAPLLRSGSAGAGFVRTPEGIAMAAVGRRPTGPSYLVVTRHLTRPLLQDLTLTFRTSALSIAGTAAPHTLSIPLRDASGHAVAVLNWPRATPGHEAAQAVQAQMVNAGILMGVLVLLLVGTCLHGLRQASNGEKDARTQALTDKLSGLPNRRALLDAIARQRTQDQTVVFIDLDGFKAVNDTYGHEAGDELIVTLARAFGSCLPQGAVLARLGGDEFAVLVPGPSGLAAARTYARTVLDLIVQPLHLSAGAVRIGASIGIAHSKTGEYSAQELFRRADMAMYHAKQAGKGRITEYDDAIDTARSERQQLEAEIRCGLINGEFEVAYQPICNAATHGIEAVEALVRWPRRPDGELGPDAFIAAADSSGIIHRLGLFVLQRACSDMADLDAVRLHVNISPVQFYHPEFESQVKSILDETGFPAHRLELEITERHILENPDRARALIASLAARGIGFALDDFGAGVSGIGHLQRFGLRRVKIDRALVATIGRDSQAGALLTGAVNIAHALSLSVVAEGVETEDQERLLRLVGCDLLQGYRFGRPAYFADISHRLAATAHHLRAVTAEA